MESNLEVNPKLSLNPFKSCRSVSFYQTSSTSSSSLYSFSVSRFISFSLEMSLSKNKSITQSSKILNYVDIDTEAEILGYGTSLIILNLGMYLAAPAIIINKIRKQLMK